MYPQDLLFTGGNWLLMKKITEFVKRWAAHSCWLVEGCGWNSEVRESGALHGGGGLRMGMWGCSYVIAESFITHKSLAYIVEVERLKE